jgi:hypothetical protein
MRKADHGRPFNGIVSRQSVNRLKQRLIAITQPKPAPWKRRVLWIMSLLIAALCIWGAWAQVQDHFANDGVWVAIGIFGILSIAGIVAAAVGDDWWVAMLLGEPPD